MATVGEIWQLALPQGSELIAGEAGLWREVSSTARLRPRPPGFESLTGSELAFVSLQSLRLLDEDLALASVIGRLAETKAAAVAVLGEVDSEARSAADRYVLPLFSLPADVNLGDVEQGALRVIVEHQAEIYRRDHDAYRQLTELAIGGNGLPAIVERLTRITGKPAALQDAEGPLRLFIAPRASQLTKEDAEALLASGETELAVWLRGMPLSASDPPVARFDLPGGLLRLVAPVVARNRVAGFLSLVALPAEMAEVDRLAVGRGAAACAIEMARQQAAIDAQDQLQIGVVDELLAGSPGDSQALQERAARLGYDLSRPHAVIVLRLPQERRGQELPDLGRAIEREIIVRRLRAPLRPRGDNVTVFYPLPAEVGEAALKRLTEDFRLAVASRVGQTGLCAGLGRLHAGLEGLRLAHQEAEQAIALGTTIFGPGRTVYFGDLGLYRLLFKIQEKDELRRFHDEMLGRLVEYDRRNNAELVATLAAYFESNYSPTDAAERMHLHRNTFIYRLRRIRDVGGLDLEDPEARLALHLALRIGETLRAAEPPPTQGEPGHSHHR
ncbi:MAG: helix-turn-helix domain-containing protein [Chloroflexi bacterium]|nr:helix-turn-helix domain-containing protein [Chloroflexota bacterium]MCL5110943.1 helix-turn-helix domain-containing protein [Chloroflexota bacterium]